MPFSKFFLKVKQYSKLLNVKIKKITVKNMKGRWGVYNPAQRNHFERKFD